MNFYLRLSNTLQPFKLSNPYQTKKIMININLHSLGIRLISS